MSAFPSVGFATLTFSIFAVVCISNTSFLLIRVTLFISEIAWERNPDGIDIGGWGLWLSVEEIADETRTAVAAAI